MGVFCALFFSWICVSEQHIMWLGVILHVNLINVFNMQQGHLAWLRIQTLLIKLVSNFIISCEQIWSHLGSEQFTIFHFNGLAAIVQGTDIFFLLLAKMHTFENLHNFNIFSTSFGLILYYEPQCTEKEHCLFF